MGKIIEKFGNLDKSIKRTIVGGLIVVVVLVLVVFVIGTLNNRELSYNKLESKISSAAESYYENHPEKLPEIEGSEVSIEVKTLVKEEYLKELSKYNSDSCDATVYVEKNNGEYIYRTYLKCDNYSTTVFGEYIKSNEEIVTKGEGLYAYDSELIYRGENVNNYIEFAGSLWRILRINADGTIRIILDRAYDSFEWDDRYNQQYDDYVGFNDFEVSRIKEYLEDFGNDTEYVAQNSKKWIVAKNVCLDKKDSVNFSNISSLECTTYSEQKYQFSLIQLEEYFVSSLDTNCNSISSSSCTNYNYLASGKYWTITPSNQDTSSVYTTGTSTKVYKADRTSNLRVVTNLSKHALYKEGNGTKENPYKIQE